MQHSGVGRHRPALSSHSGRFPGAMLESSRVRALAAAGALLCVAVSYGSETQRIGGGGGDRTVRMDCGADAFMVSMWAWGGAAFTGNLILVRALSFGCRSFGATPAEGETDSATARSPSFNSTVGWGRCADGAALRAIGLRAGSYIDAVLWAACLDAAGRQVSGGTMNVGNAAASLIPMQALECPSGEALYRVDARVGSAIDSLQGSCRPFPLQPSFDEAPAQGALLPVSVTTPAEIRLRAHGSAAPVTISFQVPAGWASHFELAAPLQAPGAIGQPPVVTRVPVMRPATGAAATAVVRILRIRGPVPVVPVSARVVPVTLTVRDGTGRSSSRSFRVQLMR